MANKRKKGYYWVKIYGSWGVDYFDGKFWNGDDKGMCYRDDRYEKINENRIPSPDEKPQLATVSLSTKQAPYPFN